MGMQDLIASVFGEDTSLYSIFDLSQDSATPSSIKKAYHKLALRCHPDKLSPEEREDGTKRFQAITAAYSVLSDADKRSYYDER